MRCAFAIALAKPSQSIRLSLVGDDGPDARRRFRKWRQSLQRRAGPFEYVVHIEPNPRGTGLHAHVLTWGSRLTHANVQAAAVAAGMGSNVNVKTLRASTPATFRYGMKLAYQRPDESGAPPPSALEFLALNGGRLLNSSRRFWRDEEGRPIRGLRQAQIAANGGLNKGRWHVLWGRV